MFVGLDCRMAQHTGIGTYLRGLISGFSSILFPYRDQFLLYGAPDTYQPPLGQVKSFQSPIYSVQEQILYPHQLKSCALWHAPHYNIPWNKGKTKLVVTIHDLIHWIFRKQFFSPLQAFYAGTMFRRVVRTADHIITVSQATKKDLIQYFSANPEKISVIHEAVDPHFRPSAGVDISSFLADNQLPESYFLYVGSLKPHKNILRLVNTFKKKRLEGKLHSDLVLLGKKDKSYPVEFREISSLRTGDGIHLLSDFPLENLPMLYQNARALVHPSLYEGFGLTPLEAMICGTPVISSNAASLPEVVGNAALLIDPLDENAIGEAMIKMEKDPALRTEYIQKGKARMSQFSWEQTAQKTLEVYEKVLAS